MTLLIIVAVIVIIIIIVANQNSSSSYSKYSGIEGENYVSSILNSLPQEYRVINNVIIPDQGSNNTNNHTTQIDHLVISPYGIFVIETKNYKGWIFGNENSKKWKETFKTSTENFFYNPIKQNWGHIYALAEHLNLNIKIFKPIVVFSDNCELNVEANTPVIYMSDLKGTIFNYRQEIIPQKDIDIIYNKLIKINLVSEETENKHIQSIEDRYINREKTIQNGICPRCGGELKLRKGKYGEFYGCSNYPKCRFTYNGK